MKEEYVTAEKLCKMSKFFQIVRGVLSFEP